MATTDAGFFGVELQRVKLRFQDWATEELQLRVDVEIVGGNDKFKWVSSDAPKASTEMMKTFKEEGMEGDSGKSFLLGLSGFYRRSSYLELSSETLNALANASFVIRVVRVDDNPAPPANAPPPKKGAPPPPVQPVDESLLEIWIPFSSLLTFKGALLDFDGALNDPVLESLSVQLRSVKAGLDLAGTQIAWKLFADNDLAEFVLGSSVVRWQGATLSSPPASWAIHYNDVVDPKAKVKPTPADFRAKYLENIGKLIETQDKVAAYSITIGGRSATAAEEVEPVEPLLPTLTLTGGRVAFDSEAAAAVPVEEEIRNVTSLWSVKWSFSPCMFLHRSQVKAFASTLMPSSSTPKVLAVTVTKTVTPEGKALEGDNLSLTTEVDLSPCGEPGAETTTLTVPFPATDESAATVPAVFNLLFSVSPAVMPAAPVLNAKSQTGGPTPKTPADVLSGKHVSATNRNRDVMKELQLEITDVVTLIAQEYVWMFPNPLPKAVPPSQVAASGSAVSTAVSGKVSPTMSLDGDVPSSPTAAESASAVPVTQIDRQAEFMHYLSTSGIYHDFKERLKPRIQRVVRDRYGARGQALGKSSIDIRGDDIAADVQSVLGELYVFLVKECNVVLNSIYTATMIGRDAAELERGPLVDDEQETPGQAFTRLLQQAIDAEADGRVVAAEQFHLERMQLLSNEAVLGSEPSSVFDVYARFGEFYLRQSAVNATVTNWNEEPYQSTSKQFFTKGRQALEIAVKAQPSQWKVGLTLACALVEADQRERAEVLLNSVLSAHLTQSTVRPGTGTAARARSAGASRAAAEAIPQISLVMPSLDDLDGYESDKLCPADPLIYAVMAAYFSIQGLPLKTRKSLVLCNRSFVEGGYKPAASTHGAPRRTIVLALANACEFLFSFGFTQLGNECLKLALASESSVTAKAAARNLPSNTVPFIKHALKRAQSTTMLSRPAVESQQDPSYFREDRLEQAISAASDSVNASPAASDVARGYLALAKALAVAKSDAAAVCDAYCRGFQAAASIGGIDALGERIVKLPSVLEAGKLLLTLGRYEEALGFLLPACRVHSSSALLLLVGVCCLRLERMEDAEDALLEANLLDNRNPEVWGYLSLLCLSCANNRLEEAEKALAQAIRLRLPSTSLLRELATSFMSVDKLLIAEDLIRRTIAIETAAMESSSSSNSPVPSSSARSRKLLADILAGQNQAAKAVQEYKTVLSDPLADTPTKISAAEACLALLTSLGRSDEVKAVNKIIEALSAALDRDGQ